MNRKLVIPICIGILAIMLPSCKKGMKKGGFSMGPALVTSYTVGQQNVVYYDSYPGTVAALNEVPLRSQVAGYITGIFFREGSTVSRGQKLYEIDRVKYQAALDQTKANVGIMEANLAKAERDADRYTKLNEQNAIARQVYDDAMTALENARMQLVAAKSALTNAQTDYNYSMITAPFTGTIGFSQVKVGAYVVPGQTLLNTVSSNNPIGVDFIVNEKSIPEFLELEKAGAQLKGAPDPPDSTFRLILPDNSDYGFNGKLSVIDRAVNPQTGTITVRVIFPNSRELLKPGMNCRVKVLNSNSGERVVIPYKAVAEQMSEFFVYKIDSGKVSQTKIEPGLTLGEYLEVRQGLKPGDKIVLEGVQKVSNGSRVQIEGSPAVQPSASRK
jgi:membrane fusion protein (multidrug efflux system)